MNRQIQKALAGIGVLLGLSLGVGGCIPLQEENTASKEAAPTLADQTGFSSRASEKAPLAEEIISQLEGMIVKVQPTEISYLGYAVQTYGGADVYASSSHELEYVMLQATDGNIHILIYSYPKAIIEKKYA